MLITQFHSTSQSTKYWHFISHYLVLVSEYLSICGAFSWGTVFRCFILMGLKNVNELSVLKFNYVIRVIIGREKIMLILTR